MSNQEVLNMGDNQLYNQIYCDLFTTNNGFYQCQNCNFGSQSEWQTSNQTNEQNCLNACSVDPRCTSYTYNTSNGLCTEYISFPTQINNNVTGTNAGYSLNFPYDYNNLSSQQKNNVQVKCADQFLNNYYTPGTNVDISSCITVGTSGSDTTLNVEPQCLYDIYKANNIPTSVNNLSSYSNGTQYNIGTISDSTIDQYAQKYNDYLNSKVAISNLETQNNAGLNALIKSDQEEFNKSVAFSSRDLVQPVMTTNKSLGISESFTNINSNNNSNNMMMMKLFTILIIIIIFIIFFCNIRR
jgi:hypothetical protein